MTAKWAIQSPSHKVTTMTPLKSRYYPAQGELDYIISGVVQSYPGFQTLLPCFRYRPPRGGPLRIGIGPALDRVESISHPQGGKGLNKGREL